MNAPTGVVLVDLEDLVDGLLPRIVVAYERHERLRSDNSAGEAG